MSCLSDCKSMARSSSAKWFSTRTRISSATSVAPKDFSSDLPSSSARTFLQDHHDETFSYFWVHHKLQHWCAVSSPPEQTSDICPAWVGHCLVSSNSLHCPP